MQVLKLLQENNIDINYVLGKELGCGADGQIFELVDFPNKVIKLCVLYDCAAQNIDSYYENTSKVLTYLCEVSPSICARVYEHKFLFHGTRNTCIGNQDYITYYYVMEKLLKITDDEKKVFHSLVSHEDRNKIKRYSELEARHMLENLHKGLDFNFHKVLHFYNELMNASIKHNDIHVRNIMKDNKGNFKLIDFDRMEIGE